MKILVTTPYEKDSLQGNTVTAKRIVSILLDAGIDAIVLSKDDEMEGGDVLIALHAKKSVHFINDFLMMNPTGKVIIYLTGTDLYGDISGGCEVCERNMEKAGALVVSQEASLASVPKKYCGKTFVVHKSIQIPEIVLKDTKRELDQKLFTVIGHLRAVKQPFMAIEALQLLDGAIRLKLALLGAEVDFGSGGIARSWQDQDSRFRWLGGVGYVETLKWMKCSVATINTSLVEGGANSVGESIVLGVPVLATRIEGNVGMLGSEYLGYFSPDSKQELADLMCRVLHDSHFLETLREQVKVRGRKFLRESEKQDWMDIIHKIR